MIFITALTIGLELVAAHRPAKRAPQLAQWHCTAGMAERVGGLRYERQSCTITILRKEEAYTHGSVRSECRVMVRYVNKEQWVGEISFRDGPLLAESTFASKPIDIIRGEEGPKIKRVPPVTSEFLRKKLAEVCPVRDITKYPAEVLKATRELLGEEKLPAVD